MWESDVMVNHPKEKIECETTPHMSDPPVMEIGLQTHSSLSPIPIAFTVQSSSIFPCATEIIQVELGVNITRFYAQPHLLKNCAMSCKSVAMNITQHPSVITQVGYLELSFPC